MFWAVEAGSAGLTSNTSMGQPVDGCALDEATRVDLESLDLTKVSQCFLACRPPVVLLLDPHERKRMKTGQGA